MLTTAQCQTVAYDTEDGIVCPDCLTPAQSNADDAHEISEYTAEEMAGNDGPYCVSCDDEIVEPTPRCQNCNKLLDWDCLCDEDTDESEPTI